MGRLQTWGASARRSPVLWVGLAVAGMALVAGGVVLATRSGPPTAPSPSTSIRAVALGDSVPYGHGLANPYRTPRVGLPTTWVSQPPSTLAYPSEVARSLGLTMRVRPTNCRLTGDQLAVSGAVADAADNTARDGQCPLPPQQARNLSDEVTAADLARHPARLVLLQDGADDIDFSRCLEYELVHALGVGVGIGTNCVVNGTVTPPVAAELSNVRASLADAIERMAPHAGRIAVLDYYQPIPGPAQIVDDAAASGLHTNLVCAGLKTDAVATDAAAQVVLTALNKAVAGAVADARAHHVTNVTLVDIATAFHGHGMCTQAPWVFSGEPLPDTTLAADIERVLAATSCDATHALVGAIPCASLAAKAHQAEQDLEGYVWRAAHPTAAGQRAIAAALERQLRGQV
jgi:hypothetical protein